MFRRVDNCNFTLLCEIDCHSTCTVFFLSFSSRIYFCLTLLYHLAHTNRETERVFYWSLREMHLEFSFIIIIETQFLRARSAYSVLNVSCSFYLSASLNKERLLSLVSLTSLAFLSLGVYRTRNTGVGAWRTTRQLNALVMRGEWKRTRSRCVPPFWSGRTLRSDRKCLICARSLAAAVTSSTNMRAATWSSYEQERRKRPKAIRITECAERQWTWAESHTEAQKEKRNTWTERVMQGNGQKACLYFDEKLNIG